MGVFNPSVDSNKLGSMGRSGSLSSDNDEDTKSQHDDDTELLEGNKSSAPLTRPPTLSVNKDSKIKINISVTTSTIYGGNTSDRENSIRKFGPHFSANGAGGNSYHPSLSSSTANEEVENSVVAGVVTECKESDAVSKRTFTATSNGGKREYASFNQSESSKILVQQQQQNRIDRLKSEENQTKPEAAHSHSANKNGVVNRSEVHNSNGSSWFKSGPSPRSNGVGGSGTYVQLPKPKTVLYERKKIRTGWQVKVSVGAGFINLGNTCYMNASLQVLLHTPAFLNWLLDELRDNDHKSKCEGNGDGNNHCTICPMIGLALSVYHSQQPVRPMLIHNKLRVIGRNFNYGRQEDSHEFLRLLLESMERSYLHARHAQRLDSRSKETTPLGQIFGGYTRSEVRCLTCRQISTTFHPHAELQLDIREVNNVEDALEFYFQEERLDNDDYKCEWCKCIQPATKKQFMEQAPIVLCIQLKRFRACGSKIKKPIFVNEELDLTKYMFHKADEKPMPAEYRLVGLVTHIGPSPNFGHYTAIAQAYNGQYYHFDDSCVRSASLNQAQNADAYIIMYESVSSAKSSTTITKSTHSPSATSTSTIGPVRKGSETAAAPVSSTSNGDNKSSYENPESMKDKAAPCNLSSSPSATVVGSSNQHGPSTAKQLNEFKFSNLVNSAPIRRKNFLYDDRKSSALVITPKIAAKHNVTEASSITFTSKSSPEVCAVVSAPRSPSTAAPKKSLVPYSSDDEDDDESGKSIQSETDISCLQAPLLTEEPLETPEAPLEIPVLTSAVETVQCEGTPPAENDKKRPLEQDSVENENDQLSPKAPKKSKSDVEESSTSEATSSASPPAVES